MVLNYKIETLLGHFPLNSRVEKGRRPASLLHAHSFPEVPTGSSTLLALELGEGESLWLTQQLERSFESFPHEENLELVTDCSRSASV